MGFWGKFSQNIDSAFPLSGLGFLDGWSPLTGNYAYPQSVSFVEVLVLRSRIVRHLQQELADTCSSRTWKEQVAQRSQTSNDIWVVPVWIFNSANRPPTKLQEGNVFTDGLFTGRRGRVSLVPCTFLGGGRVSGGYGYPPTLWPGYTSPNYKSGRCATTFFPQRTNFLWDLILQPLDSVSTVLTIMLQRLLK